MQIDWASDCYLLWFLNALEAPKESSKKFKIRFVERDRRFFFFRKSVQNFSQCGSNIWFFDKFLFHIFFIFLYHYKSFKMRSNLCIPIFYQGIHTDTWKYFFMDSPVRDWSQLINSHSTTFFSLFFASNVFYKTGFQNLKIF